jgi:WD40 repeat protein
MVIQRDGAITIWSSVNNADAEPIHTKLPEVTLEMVEFTRDGSIAFALASDGRLISIDARTGSLTGTPVALPPVNGPVRASALSEATQQYAVASEGRLFFGDINNDAQEIDIGPGDISALNFTPKGDALLVGRANGSVLKVSTANRTIESTYVPHSGAVRHLQYCKADGSLWSAADDIVISQMDPDTWEPKLQITDHTSPIRALAVDPTGVRIASTEANNITIIRYVDGNLIQWTRRGHAIEHLSFSPDGEILAMVEDRVFIVLYNVKEREEVKKLKGSPTRITGLQYHQSGEILVTTDVLGGVRVWSIKDGSMIASANAGRGQPRTLNLSESGKTIVTGGMDPEGSLRIFQLGQSLE